MQHVRDDFPASLTTLICKTPFAMTSHNGRLAPKQRCNDVSRPTGCVPIRSFSSLTFPAHQTATVTAIMVSLHIRLPSQYFFTFSSVFCTILYVWWRLNGSGLAGRQDRVHDITPTHEIAQ